MDLRDFELLRDIGAGIQLFTPAGTETHYSEDWLGRVARLERLAKQGHIRMPAPRRSMMAAEGGYVSAGPCELTENGRDALARHGDRP